MIENAIARTATRIATRAVRRRMCMALRRTKPRNSNSLGSRVTCVMSIDFRPRARRRGAPVLRWASTPQTRFAGSPAMSGAAAFRWASQPELNSSCWPLQSAVAWGFPLRASLRCRVRHPVCGVPVDRARAQANALLTGRDAARESGGDRFLCQACGT